MTKADGTAAGSVELSDKELEGVAGAMNKAELVEFIHKNGNISDSKAGYERALTAVLDTVRKGLDRGPQAATADPGTTIGSVQTGRQITAFKPTAS